MADKTRFNCDLNNGLRHGQKQDWKCDSYEKWNLCMTKISYFDIQCIHIVNI